MSLQGGKLLGSGTYGCVFDPPLLCDGEPANKNRLGKITSQVDFGIEQKAAERLAPLGLPYFLVADTKSECRPTKKQKEKNLGKCKILATAELPSLVQFTMPQGGKDLYHRMIDDEIPNYENLMLQLLEAGAYLISAKFVHYDLSPSNIVVSPAGQISMIDFGMSFAADEISDKTLELRWKVFNPSYEAEPPEINIMTGLVNEKGEMTLANCVTEIMKNKAILKTADTLLGLRLRKQEKELMDFWLSSRSAANKNWVQFWSLYWPTYDSWALGVTLLMALRTLLFKKSFVNVGFWQTKGDLVKTILRGMLQANPRKRLDCIEALKMFDPGNAFFEKFGTTWIESRAKQRAI